MKEPCHWNLPQAYRGEDPAAEMRYSLIFPHFKRNQMLSNRMQKKLSGVCGFLLFGTFGMLSGIAQVHPPERAAQSEAVTLQDDGWQREDMSDEEKERRREECNTAFEACWDWCKRSNPKSEPARWKCRDECKKKLVECMKKIPGNPIEEPDY